MNNSETYFCIQCDFTAVHISKLNRHLQEVHEGVLFPCSQCEYRATEKGNLKKHVKSTHENIKYPCSECEYKATVKVKVSNFLAASVNTKLLINLV